MTLTAAQIAYGKQHTAYLHKTEVLHEHDDCIRIAYEWLDAQEKTKGVIKRTYPIKHLIENWAGRYVSQSDVEVAAHLHPDIRGTYPHFNINSRLTLPAKKRLGGISQAGTQPDYKSRLEDVKRTYSRTEEG